MGRVQIGWSEPVFFSSNLTSYGFYLIILQFDRMLDLSVLVSPKIRVDAFCLGEINE